MGKRRVIVIDSDQHCGSQLGLITPEGVWTSDNNHFSPGPAMRWLWGRHQNYVDDASIVIKKERERGATAHYVNLGDLTDNDHHGTHQIIGRDLGTHVAAARNVLRDGFLQLDFDTLHFVMGTPSHVGPGGALEKAIASDIEGDGYPVIRCPFNGGHTIWPYLYARFFDYLLDFRHHGRTGQREHTTKSYAALYAYDIHGSHVNEGREPPDIAIRAHKHKMHDSGPDLRGITRVLSTGCWQFSSEWVYSKSFETRPDLGGWIIVIDEDMRGPYEPWIRPFKYNPEPIDLAAEVWTP
jgi:hypothetical protein